MVAITFFLLAIYVTWDAVKSPIIAPVGIILAVFSLAVVPTLAFAKQRIGKEMGSRALVERLQGDVGLLLLVTDHVARCWRVHGSRWWWADPVSALAILPVIFWQGWETLSKAREPADHEDWRSNR